MVLFSVAVCKGNLCRKQKPICRNEKDECCNIIFSLQYVDPRLLSNWKSWQDWGIDSRNAKESNSMWCIHSKESCVCLCCGIWCFCNGKVLESDGGESPYFCWLEHIFSYSKWVSESWVDWQGLRNVKEYKEQHVALSSLKSLHWNPQFLPAHGSHVYVIIMHASKAIFLPLPYHAYSPSSCSHPCYDSLPAHIPISHTHLLHHASFTFIYPLLFLNLHVLGPIHALFHHQSLKPEKSVNHPW